MGNSKFNSAISFNVSRKDEELINKIAERALRMDTEYNEPHQRKLLDWKMDFTAVHANGNPLRLAELLKADDFNFAHDAFGIARKLDRSTGQLTDMFLPRFSRKEKAVRNG